MNLKEAIKNRHSVRVYTDQKIEGEVRDYLLQEVQECNNESGLHIQACLNEPNAFNSLKSHYGRFRNVKNYIAIVGKNQKDIEEKCGYYGERIVLRAQQLGLNSCWVASTYSKSKSPCKINADEKLWIVIAIGYGVTDGHQRKSKTVDDVSSVDQTIPEWFKQGVEAALLAPTAINQQKFKFILKDNLVEAKAGFGFNTRLDLGIVKYHFEIGAGRENFSWKL